MAAAEVINPEVQMGKFEPQKQEALALAERAQQITIADNQTYQQAGEMVKAIREKRTWWKNLLAPVKQAAQQAHKALCNMEGEVDSPLESAEKQLTRAMVGYTQEQERVRLQLEKTQREEAERIAKAEAEQRAQEAQLNAAIEAEAQGDTQTAEAILESPTVMAPVYVPPVVIASTVRKVAGISNRSNWKWRPTDESLVPRAFLCLDEKKLTAYAKAMREQAQVSGIEFFDEQSVAIRL